LAKLRPSRIGNQLNQTCLCQLSLHDRVRNAARLE
jgi:hypothetical protein